jgi:hypothetical protein
MSERLLPCPPKYVILTLTDYTIQIFADPGVHVILTDLRCKDTKPVQVLNAQESDQTGGCKPHETQEARSR